MSTFNFRSLEGNWHIILGKLQQKCGKFHHDDLKFVRGKEEELFGQLEKRTPMTKQQIRRFVAKMSLLSRPKRKETGKRAGCS